MDIRETYHRSRNLKREVKDKLDRELASLTDTLTNGPCDGDLEEYEDLFGWGAAVGQLLYELEAQKGFSKALISEMEQLRGEGLTLVQRWCNDEPLNLTEEELKGKRVEWRSGSNAKRGRKAGNKRPIGQEEATTTDTTSSSSTDTPPAQRPRLDPAISSPNIGQREIQNQAKKPPRTRAQEAARTRERKKTIRVEAEGKTYAELVRDLKRRVNTLDLNIRLIRRLRGKESAIIELEDEDNSAAILVERIRGAGHTAAILGPRTARIYLARLDPTTTDQEILTGINRKLGVDTTSTRSIFTRDNGNGTKAVCLELPKTQADRLVKEGKLQIGWTESRVRLFVNNTSCYRCGNAGHIAVDCRKPVNVCFQCGEPGHVQKDCQTPFGQETTMEEDTPVEAEQTAPQAVTLGPLNRPGTRETRRAGETVLVDASTQTDATPDWPKATTSQATYSSAVQRGRNENRIPINKGVPNERSMERNNREPEEQAAAKKPRKTTAIVVELRNNTYEQTIQALKDKVTLPAGVKIKGIRKTKRGLALIETSSRDDAEQIKAAINEVMEDAAEVQLLGHNTHIKIRGLDALTEVDEIIAALASESRNGNELAQSAVMVRTFLYPWQERAAIVRMPTEMAEPLLEKGRIKIGWTTVRLTTSTPRPRPRRQDNEGKKALGHEANARLGGGSDEDLGP